MYASFPLGGIWDLILLIPDHCRSNYFTLHKVEIPRFILVRVLWIHGSLYSPRVSKMPTQPTTLLEKMADEIKDTIFYTSNMYIMKEVAKMRTLWSLNK